MQAHVERPPIERPRTGAPLRDDAGPHGPRRWWLPPAALVVLGWLALYPATRHYGNPDGPSYVAVAELWLSGAYGEAVNAYWGPLLSWAAAPLIALGVPGLDALRLVLLGGALLTLPPLRHLARLAGASEQATAALLCAVAPFLVYNALFGLYPDVLVAAALLGCCAALFRPAFPTSTVAAVAAGALAGVAFLGKAYALPVALVLLPLGAALHLLGPAGIRPRRALRQGLVALATLLVVVGGWAAVLSAVYGEPTLSTSAGFNARLVGPTSAGNPYNHPGLFAPSRPGAVSAWEEPSRLPIPERRRDGDVSPPGEVAHRLQGVVGNGRIVAGSLLRRAAPIVLLAGLALLAAARRRRLPPVALLGTVLAAVVYAGGLLLIIAIERYTWAPALLLVPAAAVGLDVLVGDRRRWLPAVAALLVAVLAATSVHGLLPRWQAHREVARAAAALEGGDGLAGAVATAGSWQETHLLCHHVGCAYHGRPVAESADAAAAELRAAGVDRLVVWRGDADAIAGLPAPTEAELLHVYAVTADGLDLERRVSRRR